MMTAVNRCGGRRFDGAKHAAIQTGLTGKRIFKKNLRELNLLDVRVSES